MPMIIGKGTATVFKKSFFNDAGLTEIEISGDVKTISDCAFEGCINLKSVVLNEGLRRISRGAFSGCTSLRSIAFPKSLVSLQGNTFSGCLSLQSIILSDSIRRGIEQRTFADCISLREIIIPAGISRINKDAFSGCKSLKSILFKNNDILIEEGAFRDCECLTESTLVFIRAHTPDNDVIDIISDGKGEAGRLSNFTHRGFIFDGVECGSVEGVLQSFKCPDPAEQRSICALSGSAAKSSGEKYNVWMENQILYWQGNEFLRSSKEYQALLERLYDSVFEQDAQYRADLRAVCEKKLDHSIGINNKSMTVLTRKEFINELKRLQARAKGSM